MLNRRIVSAYFVDAGFPAPDYEYAYINSRKFRLDIAWVPEKIGIEVQGGIYRYKPSHTSASGILRDMEKNNLGLVQGWRVFKVVPNTLLTAECVGLVAALWTDHEALDPNRYTRTVFYPQIEVVPEEKGKRKKEKGGREAGERRVVEK